MVSCGPIWSRLVSVSFLWSPQASFNLPLVSWILPCSSLASLGLLYSFFCAQRLHFVSLASKVPFGLLWSLLPSIGPQRPLWLPLISKGLIWPPVASIGFLRSHLVSVGLRWSPLVSSGLVQSPFGLLDSSLLSCGFLWSPVQPLWHPKVSFRFIGS